MSRESTIAALESQFSELRPLFRDGTTELMANEDGSVSVERDGRLWRTRFEVDRQRRYAIIGLLAGYHGTVCNREAPSLAVPFPILHGGRVQALVPPLTGAPVLSIRLPSRTRPTVESLTACGMLTQEQAADLVSAVQDHKNILVAGGAGSGKTTLAGALLDVIRNERLVVIEDTRELRPRNRNTVFVATDRSFSTRDAVVAALRLRPDRIVIGEIRDGHGALELCKAWTTGHPGGIGTIHASSAKGVRTRLRTLMQETVESPSDDLINSAIEWVVFVTKSRCGTEIARRVTRILRPKAKAKQ